MMEKQKTGLKTRTGIKGGSWALGSAPMDLNQVIFCDSYSDNSNGETCLECFDNSGNLLFGSCNF